MDLSWRVMVVGDERIGMKRRDKRRMESESESEEREAIVDEMGVCEIMGMRGSFVLIHSYLCLVMIFSSFFLISTKF